MVEGFANHWMRDVIAAYSTPDLRQPAADDPTDEFLTQALYSVRPEEFSDILSNIRDFPGYKLLLSCTDRTALDQAVKQGLCFADLVIVIPAPLWVSCSSLKSDRYAEFNYESIGRCGCWSAPLGVLKNVSRLLAEATEAFGAGFVTFLPTLDDSRYPCSSLDPSLAPLPRPYSGSTAYTKADIQLEAFYGLCRERLIAEYLGAMHMNVLSFSVPVLGDFSVGAPLAQEPLRRSLIQIVLPDVTGLSIPDLLDFRRDATESCSQFSALTADALKPQEERPHDGEFLQTSIATLSHQIELTLQNHALAPESIARTSFVLGSGGHDGSVMQAVDYLVGGGQLSDLVGLLINAKCEPRLKIQAASMLADLSTWHEHPTPMSM